MNNITIRYKLMSI